MPAKLRKGIKVRRRSSAQPFDETENPPQSSFRLIERSDGAGRSLDGFTGGRKYAEQIAARPLSHGPYDFRKDGQEPPSTVMVEHQHRHAPHAHAPATSVHRRKSGLTLDSFSTGPANHSAASSMRLSSASTVPSSTDLSLDLQRTPVPRKAVAEFTSTPRPSVPTSYDSHASLTSHPAETRFKAPATPEDSYNSTPVRSNRAMRVSSASTTKSRPLEEDEDHCRASDLSESSSKLDPLKRLSVRNESPIATEKPNLKIPVRKPVPPSVSKDQSRELRPSLDFWTSSESNENLIASTSSESMDSSRLQQETRQMMMGPQSTESIDRTRSTGLMLTTSPSLLQSSSDLEHDSDHSAGLGVSIPSAQASQPLLKHKDPEREVPSQQKNGQDRSDLPKFDSPSVVRAELTREYEQRNTAPEPIRSIRKVMTPEQFDRYRQQQESQMKLEASRGDCSDEEDGNDLDDEDAEEEAERGRQAMRQRRKQEAHLSVFRQQMIKVTGEKRVSPNSVGSRPLTSRANASLPNLKQRGSLGRLHVLQTSSGGPSSEDGDEDDDIPLGVLAAHGFPKMTRPPARLANIKSSSGLSVQSGPVARMSLTGTEPREPTEQAKGKMPAFARKLPREPFYGESKSNPGSRESFRLNGVYPPARGLTPPGRSSSGLVGFGIGEDRPRAMRRSTENTRMKSEGDFRPYQPFHGGLPGMMPLDMFSGNVSSDRSARGRSAQIDQMMQLHMQWMQQMHLMMTAAQRQGGLPTTRPISGSMPRSPSAVEQHQAISTAPQLKRPQGQRASSSRSSNVVSSNRTTSSLAGSTKLGKPHTPSIAPSERSNIGLAPRYRPVSMAQFDKSDSVAKPRSPIKPRGGGLLSTEVEADDVLTNSAPGHTPGSEEDDDDEAWAEMIRKRDLRKSTWKTKKNQADMTS